MFKDTHLEHLLDSVHELRSHAVSRQHGHWKGSLHPHVFRLSVQPAEPELRLEGKGCGRGRGEAWRTASRGQREAWADRIGTRAYLAGRSGLSSSRGTQTSPCPRVAGGDHRLQQRHASLGGQIWDPRTPNTAPTLPSPENLGRTLRSPTLPGPRAPGLTRVSQRTQLNVAMFGAGRRAGSDARSWRGPALTSGALGRTWRFSVSREPAPPAHLPCGPEGHGTSRHFANCFIFSRHI